jgi:hypothetical protein
MDQILVQFNNEYGHYDELALTSVHKIRKNI